MVSELAEEQMAGVLTAGRGRGPRGGLTRLRRAGHCPVPGCREQIDPTRLMCRRHWYLVPKPIRDQVWATWRSGHGAFSRQHAAAVQAAIAACQDAPVSG